MRPRPLFDNEDWLIFTTISFKLQKHEKKALRTVDGSLSLIR